MQVACNLRFVSFPIFIFSFRCNKLPCILAFMNRSKWFRLLHFMFRCVWTVCTVRCEYLAHRNCEGIRRRISEKYNNKQTNQLQWNRIRTFSNWQFPVIMIFCSINLLKFKIQRFNDHFYCRERSFNPIGFTENILECIQDINRELQKQSARFEIHDLILYLVWRACVRPVRISIHFFHFTICLSPSKKNQNYHSMKETNTKIQWKEKCRN